MVERTYLPAGGRRNNNKEKVVEGAFLPAGGRRNNHTAELVAVVPAPIIYSIILYFTIYYRQFGQHFQYCAVFAWENTRVKRDYVI